ncbi:E7 [Human papillomavirus type 85]|uniref:Protein E7 n=2 Tax=Papillomaviridae TaxID=151340 RepID=A0A1X9RQW4_9PAPI|nr:E7 [Human papillomavirus type 85]AAD24182.1 putative transforming protein E7 [human papillomavirus 85]ARQ82681.1 E7 [Human papillomavirus type 85]
MHGPKPTVHDIVLDLEPYNEVQEVDLYCYEELNNSEEEIDEPDNAINHRQPLLARREELQRHTICCVCCKCEASLQLVVESSAADLRDLQQLFLGTLSFLCPLCAVLR